MYHRSEVCQILRLTEYGSENTETDCRREQISRSSGGLELRVLTPAGTAMHSPDCSLTGQIRLRTSCNVWRAQAERRTSCSTVAPKFRGARDNLLKISRVAFVMGVITVDAEYGTQDSSCPQQFVNNKSLLSRAKHLFANRAATLTPSEIACF